MKKGLVTFILAFGIGFAANAQTGTFYCSKDECRLELWSDGTYQLILPDIRTTKKIRINGSGKRGTYRISGATIILNDGTHGVYTRGVQSRDGKIISPATVNINGRVFIEGNCSTQ